MLLRGSPVQGFRSPRREQSPGSAPRIFIHMAAPLRPFLVSARPSERGAQCPNCFTYNLLDHLPAAKKRARGESAWELQCALCGSQFHLGEEAAPAAA